MSPEARQLAHDIADVIERNGFCKGYYGYDRHGEVLGGAVEPDGIAADSPCCYYGASHILHGEKRIEDLHLEIAKALGEGAFFTSELTGCSYDALAEWNDAPFRSKKDVIRALRSL